MRRFISYIITSVTMMLAIVIGFTPVFTKINPGREFTNGEEFVYELRVTNDEDKEVSYIPETEDEVNNVASEMKSRLDTFGVEDYSVTVEGTNSIRVSVSISDQNQLNYVRQYLAFNGKHFTLATTSGVDRIDQEELLGDKQAYIVREKDVFPYLVIPVNNVEKVRTMVDSLASEDAEVSKALHPFKEDSEEQSSPDLFLWNNVYDDDNLNYNEAQKDAVFMSYHLTKAFSSANFWYKDSSEEKTEIGILFGQGDEDNNYDVNSLEDANKAAIFYMNLINASSYSDEFKVVDLFVNETSSGVTYNSIYKEASVEKLLDFSSDVNVAMSLTLISTMVCTIIVSLILVLFYRTSAIGMVATTTSSVFLTFLLFILVMHASFTPGAIIGGVLLAVASLIGEIYYANKFKEEVYKGRSLKKANTEATKRTTMVSIDVAVITAFLGLMLYLLGGSALRPMGIILFFGAIINLVLTLTVFRLLAWLLTNTTKLQDKYGWFNIDKNKVPNLQSETKTTYEGPYQEKNFTKFKKPFMIASLVLLVASIAGIIVFGVVNKSPLNVGTTSQDTTSVYVSLREDSSITVIKDSTSFKEKVLKEVKIDETPLANNNTVDIEIDERVVYDATTDISETYKYYVVSFNGSFDKEGREGLEDQFRDAIVAVEGEDTTNYLTVSVKNVRSTVGSPNQGFVALATGLAIVGGMLYFMFRYRPSRALAMGLSATTATTITYGALVLVRISTTAITSLAMPLVALFAMLTTIYLFNKEKDLRDETKEELTLEKRKELGIKAVAISATPIFVAAIIAIYIGINYFGFGPMAWAILFAGFIVGVILSAALNLVCLTPVVSFFEKLFSKIRLPKIRRKPRKERIKLKARKNSSEPEETIFIGIND